MEWSNAKKFVIVLLALLNVVLAGLNYSQRQQSVMTAAQERAIFEVLSENGITMYTDLLTDFAPMARLSAKIPAYSKETLERIFFGGERTTVTAGEEKRIYRGKDSTLTIQGAWGLLERRNIAAGKGELTKNSAQKTAEKFINQTEYFFGSYDQPLVMEREEGYEVIFYGTYKQKPVFSNYFSILVTEEGIRQIEFSYCAIQGFVGDKKEICYSDEALLTFMREWKKEQTKEQKGGTREAAINRMELGYDLMERSSASADGVFYLEPCYRIYLMEEKPYLVNAYTCQIVNKD